MHGRIWNAIAGLVLIALTSAPAAHARDQVVTSFDGTAIWTHFYPAGGASPTTPRPTVLVGHGFGGTGSAAIDGGTGVGRGGGIAIGDLHRAGWNVLTWDARGFGKSGGSVSIDGPQTEGRDTQALIDFVAKQPEAKLDTAGDPRLGMAGSSYGGGIQLVTAGLDGRIDVIVPDISWHSLLTSLYKEKIVKQGWGLLLSAGAATSVTGGVGGATSPAGLQLGTVDPHVVSALATGASTGKFLPEDEKFFGSRGPGALVDRIRIPTLLTQGTIDTLFTLQEAITNFSIIKGNGVPVKMMWHAGGHGVANHPDPEPGRVEKETIKWFRRHLDGDKTVNTGPQFEWVADDGVWRTSAAYPLRALEPFETAGGDLTLIVNSASSTSGSPTTGAPSDAAVKLPLPAPTEPTDLVGAPTLTLRYSGVAAPSNTHVYAQIIDKRARRAVGNQVTPIPVILDGKQRTVTRPLEALAMHATPSSRHELELIAGTQLYAVQRSTGTISFGSIAVSRPAVTPVSAASPRARLRFGTVGGVARRVRGRRVRFRLFGNGVKVSGARAILRNTRGRIVARSPVFNVVKRRTVTLRFNRKVTRGSYTVTVTGRDPARRSITVKRTFRLR